MMFDLNNACAIFTRLMDNIFNINGEKYQILYRRLLVKVNSLVEQLEGGYCKYLPPLQIENEAARCLDAMLNLECLNANE